MTTGIIIGLSVGAAGAVALLVWALRERSARASAEKEVIRLEAQVSSVRDSADRVRALLKSAWELTKRKERECEALQKTVSALQRRMVDALSAEESVVWLQSELQSQADPDPGRQP